MKDTLDYPIHIHFDESSAFIEEMRKQNRNVLVHCHAGVSRSATIVCAYLMKKNNWSMDQALGFIKGKRERVRPNQNFLALLAQYE
jgi:dual specificity MAP kinase phosphatase